TMKIAVVGSRDFFLIYDYHKNEYVIDEEKGIFVNETLVNEFSDGHVLVSGGAKGVDICAEQTIDEWNTATFNVTKIPNKWKKKIFKPDWNRYGKRAGFLRNELIVAEADKVIAFWDGTSKGTKHSIDLAIKAGKPLDIYVR
ncbi:hypothetical protein LCGC14_2642380, partial [marine sediment metagenome]